LTRPPARCHGCQEKRVAWVTPRVDYCYGCLPGGPFVAPTCRTCPSAQYFSEGLCETCHPGGPSHLVTCRGCLAWGVSRERGRCWVCRWWRTHYPLADCHYCGRTTPVGDSGACRLCLEQARLAQEPGRPLNFADANRRGQQLFFANMQFHRHKAPRLKVESRRNHRKTFTPVGWRQLTLFELTPDPDVIRERALGSDSELIQYCSEVVRGHAAAHGWSKRQRNVVVYSLRLLFVLQVTPGAKINATDVLALPRYQGTINSTLDVLDAAGLLIDDRTSHVERYFAAKTSTLPEPMRTQLGVWLEVMLGGSTVAPRQHSRDPQTARLHIMGIAPIMWAWVAAGHESLAEITIDDVRTALLSQSGAHRNFAEYGLRSLFKVLKGRKMIFLNPTRGIPLTPVGRSVPLPLDTDAIRQALNSPDPAVALAVALVAFHALTSKELGELKLTHIVDGRLTLGDRVIPLAEPVRVRLAAWLDHRGRRWPGSVNAHLFVSRRSAPRLTPVGRQFPWSNTDLRPHALREDRILQEIHATGGDVRRVCDLFGLSVESALRYARTLAHPDLEHGRVSVPRTQDSN